MNFFATSDDIIAVCSFMFDLPNIQIFEQSSAVDTPLKQFRSVAEIKALIAAGTSVLISGWPSKVGAQPEFDEVTFTPIAAKRNGGKGRTVIRGPALINLVQDRPRLGCLNSSFISCWSEKGARQRSAHSNELLDEVDWKELGAVFGKLQRQIRSLSPAKIASTSILKSAFEALQEDSIRLRWGGEVDIFSPLIKRTGNRPMFTASASYKPTA